MQSISVFLAIAKFADYLVRYKCAKFHHCGICEADFWDGRPFCPHTLSVNP